MSNLYQFSFQAGGWCRQGLLGISRQKPAYPTNRVSADVQRRVARSWLQAITARVSACISGLMRCPSKSIKLCAVSLCGLCLFYGRCLCALPCRVFIFHTSYSLSINAGRGSLRGLYWLRQAAQLAGHPLQMAPFFIALYAHSHCAKAIFHHQVTQIKVISGHRLKS